MLTVERAARDIEAMRVRGAGRLARHAVRSLRDLAARHPGPEGALARDLERASSRLLATRPTAVSLRNGVEQALAPLRVADGRRGLALRDQVLEAAEGFLRRSEDAVERIAALGPRFLDRSGLVLTHCNSACAVGVIARAREAHDVAAFVTETRPWHQGRLTARQLRERGVPTAFLVDGAVNLLMPRVDWVVVGADTLACNGDVVNKVGTSLVALSAREHRVPFYVAAETYKVDLLARTGADVRIEERDPREVADPRALPPGVKVWNPVFDVTPARHVARVLTEEGPAAPREVAALLRKRRAGRWPPA